MGNQGNSNVLKRSFSDRPSKITLRASFALGDLIYCVYGAHKLEVKMRILIGILIDNSNIKINIMLAEAKAILFLQRLLGLSYDR